MLRHSAFAKTLWLLAIAVIVVRVGDAHLHFCGDGQEQRMTLHVTDEPGQHHDEAQSSHNDRDVDLSAPTYAKKVGGPDDFQLAQLVVLALALLLPVVRRLEPVTARTSPDLTPIFLLRPPLRGPPL